MMAKSTTKSSSTHASKPYTVLARRYRSREFDELIGQEPIARTLLNAIETGRTAHAYLFCGTRGVGKTSMARIFAKALNATSDLTEREAIGEAIMRGDDLDVIEIDAASNRGIDNARDLIAGSSLSPTRSPYKIYIIDEVHQLTKEAFNALLKTMEEPPSHVKFILCTTEPQKVPATIQSRCQRFDFRAIPTAKIAEHIRGVLKQEQVKADDEVIAQVARLGNGSMRDALSILDRLLAGGIERLTVEHLEDMLGLPDHDLIVRTVDAFIAADAAAALNAGDALVQKSSSVEQALELLTDHLRSLMILAACEGEAPFLDLSEDHLKAARRQSDRFDAPGLVHMIALCDAVARNGRGSVNARALFDAALVRLAMSRHFADIPALLAGVKPAAEVEAKKKVASLSPVAPRSEARPAEPPQQRHQVFAAGHPTPVAVEVKPPPAASSHGASAAGDQSRAGDDLWNRMRDIAAERTVDRQCLEHLVYQSFDGVLLKVALDERSVDIAPFVLGQIDRLNDLARRAGGQAVRVQVETNTAQSPAAALDAASESPPAVVRAAAGLLDATIIAVE